MCRQSSLPITYISNQLPDYCGAYTGHAYTDFASSGTLPRYVGTPERGGYWVEARDYDRALDLYPRVIRMWRLADQRGAIARCLECLGFIAQAQASETPEPLPLLRRAATLFGAAEAIRKINNTPMTPWEQTEYDGHMRALRSRLDPDALDAAWRAGARLDLDQAVDFATHPSAR